APSRSSTRCASSTSRTTSATRSPSSPTRPPRRTASSARPGERPSASRRRRSACRWAWRTRSTSSRTWNRPSPPSPRADPPGYSEPVDPVAPFAAVLRADNPGPMTLDGTRSYVLRAPGAPGCVVVDPGPDLEPHLATLADAGPVELVLVTHRHADHTGGLARFRALTGAPSRGASPEFCA